MSAGSSLLWCFWRAGGCLVCDTSFPEIYRLIRYRRSDTRQPLDIHTEKQRPRQQSCSLRAQPRQPSRAAGLCTEVRSPRSWSIRADSHLSLQQALYEPAIEYYTNHSKRVRRKRNRHSQSSSSYVHAPPVSPTAVAPRPLRPEGWTVRYEYKMACFAEFRGEDQVALKYVRSHARLLSRCSLIMA